MMAHEDVHFQLVDLPAISPEHPVPWLAGALQTADAALLVLDLADPGCLDQLEAVQRVLSEERRAHRALDGARGAGGATTRRPFALRLPTLMLANKADGPPSNPTSRRFASSPARAIRRCRSPP